MMFGDPIILLASAGVYAATQPGAAERRKQYRESVEKQRLAEEARLQAKAEERAANRRFAEAYMRREKRG